MHVSVIIAAGGRGRRFGAGVPKQLLDLAGQPMLQWSVDALLGCPRVDDAVVVVPPEWIDDPPACVRRAGIRLTAGGERRQDSVARGFDALPAEADLVLVHDAARPLVDAAAIEAVIDAAAEAGAALLALPARDTVKLASAAGAGRGGAAPEVERTLPRERVYLAQTPQGFRRDVLGAAVALGRGGVEATDEAALAERAGFAVRLVEGRASNIKVTGPEDLVVAEALVRARDGLRAGAAEAAAGPDLRVGSGYDLHRFAAGRALVLGGVSLPSEEGLAGHSDADALCHAVTDAVLGAAALGDIGTHFPDTDGRWQGASSAMLLGRAVRLAAGRGFRVVNVDATVVTERPRIGPFRAAIVASLAAALGLPESAVSVKAKTNERVDAVGRGEALAVHATALLRRDRPTGEPPAAGR